MRKPLGIQKCNRRTDGPTNLPTDTARCRVACPRLKTNKLYSLEMKIDVNLLHPDTVIEFIAKSVEESMSPFA